MNSSRKTAGVTLVLTVLMVMFLLSAIVIVTSQLALSARRSAADQESINQAQYVAESGIARSQARLNLISDLLSSDLTIPANTLSSTVLTDVLNLCGLSAVPATLTNNILCSDTSATGNVLASVSPGSSQLSLFTDFLTDTNFANRGYPVSGTSAESQFWAENFAGKALNDSAGSGTFATNVGLKLKQVKMLGPDTYQMLFTLPDVSSTSTATDSSKRSVKVAAVNTTYTLNINRGSFA